MSQTSNGNVRRSALIVAAGDLSARLIAFATAILLLRTFNPDDYGVITAMLTLMAVLPVVLDFGTTPSVIRFGPLLTADGDLGKYARLFQSIFFIRVVFSGVILAIGLPLCPKIAQMLLHNAQENQVVAYALVGSVGLAFFQFFLAVFQSREKFTTLTVLKVSESLVKLLIIAVILRAVSNPAPSAPIFIYALAPVLMLLSISRYFPEFLKGKLLRQSEFKSLLKLSFWYMVSTVCLMVFTNFDVVIISILKPASEVGYFGAGQKMASILYIIINVFLTLVIPFAGKRNNSEDLKRFLIRISILSAILAVLMVPLVYIGPWMVHLIAGDKYISSIGIFSLLAWDHVVMMLFAPVVVAMIMINRPQIIAFFTFAEMVLNIIGDILIVPAYGGTGAAFVTLIVRIVVSTFCAAYVALKLRNRRDFVRKIF